MHTWDRTQEFFIAELFKFRKGLEMVQPEKILLKKIRRREKTKKQLIAGKTLSKLPTKSRKAIKGKYVDIFATSYEKPFSKFIRRVTGQRSYYDIKNCSKK